MKNGKSRLEAGQVPQDLLGYGAGFGFILLQWEAPGGFSAVDSNPVSVRIESVWLLEEKETQVQGGRPMSNDTKLTKTMAGDMG